MGRLFRAGENQVLLGQHLFNPQVMKRDINADDRRPSNTCLFATALRGLPMGGKQCLKILVAVDSANFIPHRYVEITFGQG